MALNMGAALGADTGVALVIFAAQNISDYEHLIGVPKIVLFFLESLVHGKVKTSYRDFLMRTCNFSHSP